MTYYLQGMHGLGDNIHQRAIVRQLMQRGPVWLETPWPSVYEDLVGERLMLVRKPSRLRTQAKNINREAGKFTAARVPRAATVSKIWYSHDDIRARGSFVGAMCANSGLPAGDFSLPVPTHWRERAQRWIDRWKPQKPLMIYRPLIERTEWNGCAQRNPGKDEYFILAQSIRDQFFVISIADLEDGVEWQSGRDIGADVELHHGQLDFETISGLVALAGIVFCSPGFAIPLAQAIGTPLVAVFGGHESARLYDHGRATDHLISPVNACECFSKSHCCDKTIDLDSAIPALRRFIDAHYPQPRIDQTDAA